MDIYCKKNREKICPFYCVLWRRDHAKILFKESHLEWICFHLQGYLHGLSVCSQLSHARNLDVLIFANFIVSHNETVCHCSSLGFFVSIFVYFIRSCSIFNKWIIMSILEWKKIDTLENFDYVDSQLKSTMYICTNSSCMEYFHIFLYLWNSFWEW